jgi:glutathione S-transferase kappa 1
MAANKLKITVFFDTISPYSYFCWEVLLRYKQRWNLFVDVRPVFLGGIMQKTGNKPPAMLAPRALFQAQDLERNAALFGLQILPSPGNFFTEAARKVLTLQRLLCGRILDGANEKEVENLVSVVFRSLHGDKQFRDGSNDLILNDDTIVRMLVIAGMSETAAKQALKRAGDADVKNALQANTDMAVESGAYGSPTMLIHGGKAPFYNGRDPWLVFGSDRFEQIAFVCGLPYVGPNPPPLSKAKI